MSLVGYLVFKTSEAFYRRLVGSTPTSSARNSRNLLINKNIIELS